MDQSQNEDKRVPEGAQADEVKGLMRSVIEEYMTAERRQSEPAYKTELVEERKRREQLEKRVNELVAENQRSRQAAEEADRHSQIRAELQKLGVSKVDLAFRIVKDEVVRTQDGALTAKTAEGEKGLREFLTGFVKENPEFLPARIAGGSGAVSPSKSGPKGQGIELERIQPGMSREELQRVREQISQVMLESLGGE
jgi:hypothetical protein